MNLKTAIEQPFFIGRSEDMNKFYTVLQCRSCGKTTILVSEEIRKDGYIKCPHCSSRKFKHPQSNDSLKDCMKHSAYRKEKGKLRQVRFE